MEKILRILKKKLNFFIYTPNIRLLTVPSRNFVAIINLLVKSRASVIIILSFLIWRKILEKRDFVQLKEERFRAIIKKWNPGRNYLRLWVSRKVEEKDL